MTEPRMDVHVRDDGTTTLINVFTVDPSDQDELVRLEIDGISTIASKAPGFVRGAIHRSLDGTRVVNYLHWEPGAWQRAHEVLGDDPDFVQHMQDVRKVATADPQTYEVIAVIEGEAS
ncbi:MAG TPA: hypothetical protein VFB41_10555 [Solirubrobacteraceae bacterium]|nr:hypothetical protein [Solirubrobacteraceae bacterium]